MPERPLGPRDRRTWPVPSITTPWPVRWVGFAAGIATAIAVARKVARHVRFRHSGRRIPDLAPPLLSARRLRAVLEPARHEQILELGPGTGVQSMHVASRLTSGGLTVAGLQQHRLAHLQRRAAARGVPLCTVLADPTRLPFDDSTFDAGYLVTTLVQLPDRPAALSELRRVVRPGGRLIVGEFAEGQHVPLGKLVRMANREGLRYVRHVGDPLAYCAEFTTGRDAPAPRDQKGGGSGSAVDSAGPAGRAGSGSTVVGSGLGLVR